MIRCEHHEKQVCYLVKEVKIKDLEIQVLEIILQKKRNRFFALMKARLTVNLLNPSGQYTNHCMKVYISEQPVYRPESWTARWGEGGWWKRSVLIRGEGFKGLKRK